MKRLLMTACLGLFLIQTQAADERNEVGASLKGVTVYRSGAEMTHTATAQIKGGSSELIIDNISNNIDSNSIQIKAPSSVTILHWEFSRDYMVSNAVTQHQQALQDSLEKVWEAVGRLDAAISNTNELLEVLKLNRDIKGVQTGLSVAELQKLMDYYAAKWTELQNTLAQQTERRTKTVALANKLDSQIKEEQKKNTSTAGRLTLQLNAAMATKAEFTISYIARNAYWTPYYDVRADNILQPLKLFYKAKIVQTTGIDWKAVKLSLSTATPSQKKTAPDLSSWFLGYVNPFATENNAYKSMLTGRVAGVSVPSLDEVVVGYGTQRKDDGIEAAAPPPPPVYVVNGNIISAEAFRQIDPNAIKSLNKLKVNEAKATYGDVAAGGATVVELKNELGDYVAVTGKTLTVNFAIDIPLDVPTNGKEQTATLQTLDVAAVYQHYAVPKQDEETYLLAKISDWEKLNLLPGEANIILEGTYTGKTFINPNSPSDTLNLTLGQDKRVVVERRKLSDYSSIKFLGSNKLQKFTYEITVKNNKAETVAMLLKDQYPVSTNKEIEVELTESAGATVAKETGGLSWRLSLAPNESRKLRFSYEVKYPKEKVINVYE